MRSARFTLVFGTPAGSTIRLACLFLLAVAGSFEVAAQGPFGKVPLKCNVGQTITFDGTDWVCADVKTSGSPKVYDSKGVVVGSWLGFTGDGQILGQPVDFSYVLLESPGAEASAMIATNTTGDSGSPFLGTITPGLYSFTHPFVFFTGPSCGGTAYTMAPGGLLTPATTPKTGSPLATQVWAPKAGGTKLSEGNAATNPASPLRSVLFNRTDLPPAPAECAAIPSSGLGFDTGPLAEAMMIISDLAAAWKPPFRIGP